MSVLGAWRDAHGQHALDELFTALARSFSDCTSYAFELQAYRREGGEWKVVHRHGDTVPA